MLKLMISKVIKNLVAMAVTEKFIFWVLQLWVKNTNNLIDDNAVSLVESAYKNDVDGVKTAIENLADLYRK